METSTFQIPPKWCPGTDRASKNLLKHPEAKDIITKAVVGTNGDAYTIGDSEWPDGTRSDVLYVPLEASLGLAPIIIEVQHTVNFQFVNRSIRYCTMAYQRFKTMPVLIIFCINSTSGISSEFLGPSTLPCAMTVFCGMWAKNCYIINNDLAKQRNDQTLDPFTALALFLINKETCLLAARNWKDPTLVKLFGIMKEIMKKNAEREVQLLDAINSICDANMKLYQEILDTSERLAYTSSLSQHAQQGLEKMRSVKRQFQEENDQNDGREGRDDAEGSSSTPSSDEQKYQRTMEFVTQFKQTRKKMNWKACHERILERPDMIHYKNSETLRVRFEQYTKK